MLFHKSFLKILDGTDSLFKIRTRLSELDENQTFINKHRQTNIDFDTFPKTSDSVIKLAPLLIEKTKKDQILLETNEEYYVAKDIQTNTIYICFKNLMMIDIDMHKVKLHQDDIIAKFKQSKEHCFRIVKSKNGYHVFCTSAPFPYRNQQSIQFMLEHSCDFYYSIYAYIRGYSVRLNPKFAEANNNIYTDLGTFGNNSLLDSQLDTLVDKHLMLCNKYKSQVNMSQ